MALDTDRLKTALIPRIKSAFEAAGATDPPPTFKLTAMATDLAQAIAEEVINEFKNNAELVIDPGPPPTGTVK